MRILAGLETSSQGQVLYNNISLETISPEKRPTCLVFQSLALFPHLSVGANIEFPLKIRGETAESRKKTALELLSFFRLPAHFYSKKIHECSGGEKQRIALARALAYNAEIILFDEPLSALDYRLKKTLGKEIKELHKRTGKTFVYITHSLEEAMVMSDRLAILDKGSIVQVGTPSLIYTNPINSFVADFMGEVNFISPAQALKWATSDAAKQNIKKITNSSTSGKILIRPEHFYETTDSNDAIIACNGVINEVYHFGSKVQYLVDTHSDAMLTYESQDSNSEVQERVGKKISLAVHAEHLKYLPS